MRSWLLPLCLLAGCSAPGAILDDADDGEADGVAEGEADAKTDGSELRVRAGQTTVWIDRDLTWRVEDGTRIAVIHGRTSRNLVNAFSFVPDDAFGAAQVTGPRSFVVELRGGHELNSILSGLPIFVALDTTSGTPTRTTARIDLGTELTAFQGSAAVFVSSTIAPVYVGGPEALRYRTSARTTGALTVSGAGTPSLSPTADGFLVDFTYGDLATVLGTNARITFAIGPRKKTAKTRLHVRGVGLTTNDAYDTWPTTCEAGVLTCVLDGGDVSACGSYREVQHCVHADVCEVLGEAELSLTPLGIDFAWQAAEASYLADCQGGGDWCAIAGIDGYLVPECLTAPAPIADVVAEAIATDQRLTGLRFADGVVLTREALAATALFGQVPSSSGPGLLAAIDAHMANGPLVAWKLETEQSCHNCHEFESVYVLWYPQAFRVVVAIATHGYDS